MGDLSANFSRIEFACNCECGQDTIDAELITMIEAIRQHYDSPVTINSGNRCVSYNAQVGGSTNSQHILSRAADIKVEGIPAPKVANYIDSIYPDKYGLGRYDSFTHVDSRTGKARWSG